MFGEDLQSKSGAATGHVNLVDGLETYMNLNYAMDVHCQGYGPGEYAPIPVRPGSGG